MNIEEKAKAYDIALARARESLKDGGISQNTIDYMTSIFPELKESEDERIRKALIFYLGGMPENTELRNGITIRDVFAWLEKQGETFTKKDVDDAYLKGIGDAKNELEKQGEQKPVEWSEEDDRALGVAILALNRPYECDGKYDREFAIKWLKSLKERIVK